MSADVLDVLYREACFAAAEGHPKRAVELREAHAAVAALIEAVKTHLFFTDPAHKSHDLRAALAGVQP